MNGGITLITGISNTSMCCDFVSSDVICLSVLLIAHITTLNNVDEEELEEVDASDALEIHDGGSLGQMDISVGSSNPNITVQDENSVGTGAANAVATSNVQIPTGTGNKVTRFLRL